MFVKHKKQFNKAKFKQAILYLIAHSPNQTIEGKKKLAKLLYFGDFNYFEAYEKPLTGATYRALKMGPVPMELQEVIKEMQGHELKISKQDIGLENDLEVFSLDVLEKDLHFDSFSAQEKKVLDRVLEKYGQFSGGELERITHAEAPYNAVGIGEYMPYELAFYRGKTSEELIGP